MVVFTCNHCGESLQKPRVEKHYQASTCSRNPIAVSCMDCFKDFKLEEYVAHTKCITEDERYSAKGTVHSVKKGEVKQSSWVQTVNAIIEQQQNAKPSVKRLLEMMTKYDNIPRKKVKFVNFVQSSSGGRIAPNDIEEVWSLLEAQKNAAKAETAENGNNDKKKRKSDEDTAATNGEDSSAPKKKKKKNNRTDEQTTSTETAAPAAAAAAEDKSAKTKKNKRKATETESEEKVESTETVTNNDQPKKKKKKGKTTNGEQEQVNGNEEAKSEDTTTTENKEEKPNKKKKKNKNNNGGQQVAENVAEEETAVNGAATENGTAEEKAKKKKKNKNNSEAVVATITVPEQQTPEVNGTAESPKKKKKSKATNDTNGTVVENGEPATQNGTTDNNYADKQSKNKKNKQKENGVGDSTTLETSTTNDGEFCWRTAIIEILKSQPTGINKDKLKAKVFEKYTVSKGKIDNEGKLTKQYSKKIKKIGNVKLENDVFTWVE